jgi:hypothetical protein
MVEIWVAEVPLKPRGYDVFTHGVLRTSNAQHQRRRAQRRPLHAVVRQPHLHLEVDSS